MWRNLQFKDKISTKNWRMYNCMFLAIKEKSKCRKKGVGKNFFFKSCKITQAKNLIMNTASWLKSLPVVKIHVCYITILPFLANAWKLDDRQPTCENAKVTTFFVKGYFRLTCAPGYLIFGSIFLECKVFKVA